MNLSELLATYPPKPASAYTPEELATLRALWLVMPVELADYLVAEHAEHGDPHNVPHPIELTDGRMALCADLLTEITPGGLYAKGFDVLTPNLFEMVSVLAHAEFIKLLPQTEPLA